MPRDFVQTLNTVAPSDQGYRNYAQPEAIDFSPVADLLGAATKNKLAQKQAEADSGLLSNVASILNQTDEATYSYELAQNDVLNALSVANPEDAETLKQIYSTHERLKQGLVQGVMSPTAAKIQKTKALREAISMAPHLASEIRALFSDGGGGGAGGSIRDNPIDKGVDRNIEEASYLGITPAANQIAKMADKTAAQAQNEVAERQAAGTLKAPDVTSMYYKTFESMSAGLATNLQGLLTRGEFKQENILKELTDGKGALQAQLNKSIAEYEAENKVLFPTNMKEELIRNANDIFDYYITITEKLDSQGTLQRRLESDLKIMETKGVIGLVDQFGPIVTLARYAGDAGIKLIDEASSLYDKLKHGLGPALDEIAVNDPKTRLLLNSLRGKDGKTLFNELISRKMAGEETPPGSIPEEIDTATSAAILEGIKKGKFSDADAPFYYGRAVATMPPAYILQSKSTLNYLNRIPAENKTAVERNAVNYATRAIDDLISGDTVRDYEAIKRLGTMRFNPDWQSTGVNPFTDNSNSYAQSASNISRVGGLIPSRSVVEAGRQAVSPDPVIRANQTYDLINRMKGRAAADAFAKDFLENSVKPAIQRVSGTPVDSTVTQVTDAMRADPIYQGLTDQQIIEANTPALEPDIENMTPEQLDEFLKGP